MNEKSFPLAINAPETEATPLTQAMAEHALQLSAKSPRRRMLQRLHKEDADPYHRMLNAMQPGTYFRPHRHLNPPKSETLIVLRGAFRVVLFDDAGQMTNQYQLSPEAECFGIDLLPTVYHTLIVLQPDTLMFESKTGPYTKATDKDFAPWAPVEGSMEATAYLDELMQRTSVI